MLALTYSSEVITARFIVHHMPGYEDVAFKLDKQWTDPRQPFVAAHDVLEHMPDDQGTHHEEFAALGAGLWVRRDYYSDTAQREWALMTDIMETAHRFIEPALYWPAPPEPYVQTWPFNGEFERKIHAKWNFHHESTLHQWELRKHIVLGWAQFGYERAKARYPEHIPISDFFRRVEAEVRKYARMPHMTKFDIMLEPSSGTIVSSVAEYPKHPAQPMSEFVGLNRLAAKIALDMKAEALAKAYGASSIKTSALSKAPDARNKINRRNLQKKSFVNLYGMKPPAWESPFKLARVRKL